MTSALNLKVTAIEEAFASDVPVDTRSAIVHMDVLDRLAAKGNTNPSECEYLDELEQAGYDAVAVLAFEAEEENQRELQAAAYDVLRRPLFKPEQAVVPGDRLEIDPDPVLHSATLRVLKRAGVLDPVDQATYNAAREQARAELRRGGQNIGSGNVTL
jgi:hypothetical protein